MSWSRNKGLKGAIVALALVAGASAATAATLVVRSSGPSARNFPPGRALPEGGKITLRAGDEVVILDGRGTRTLKGPGTFDPQVVTAAATDSRSTFAALVAQRSGKRARVGAVRSLGGGPPRSPNLWYVDSERGGSVCVADPTQVTLWRPESTKAQTVTIEGAGKSEKIEWRPGQAERSWPATLPVANGAEFRVIGAAPQPTTLKFAVLKPAAEGLENTAVQLIRNNCNAQLDLLIETVAVVPPAA